VCQEKKRKKKKRKKKIDIRLSINAYVSLIERRFGNKRKKKERDEDRQKIR